MEAQVRRRLLLSGAASAKPSTAVPKTTASERDKQREGERERERKRERQKEREYIQLCNMRVICFPTVLLLGGAMLAHVAVTHSQRPW